jgi:hypothetical protein
MKRQFLVVLPAALLAVYCGGNGATTPTAPSHVTQPPTATFSSAAPGGTPIAGASVVTFTATGSDPAGGSVSFAWDFGDGQSGAGASVTHVFAKAGTMPVVLSATGQGGVTKVTNNVVVKSMEGTWVDADPRISFSFTQSGATLAGERDASGGSGYIGYGSVSGTLSSPRGISILIHFKSQGLTSDCQYDGTIDSAGDTFRVERSGSAGVFCAQQSYSPRRQ